MYGGWKMAVEKKIEIPSLQGDNAFAFKTSTTRLHFPQSRVKDDAQNTKGPNALNGRRPFLSPAREEKGGEYLLGGSLVLFFSFSRLSLPNRRMAPMCQFSVVKNQ